MQIENLLVLRKNNVRPDIVDNAIHGIAPAQTPNLLFAFENYGVAGDKLRQRDSSNAATKNNHIRLHVMKIDLKFVL